MAALTTISPASAASSIATVSAAAGPRDDQLAMRRACEEEVERAGVDADVHAQRDLAGRCVERAELVERPPHAVRRVAGARGM